MQETRDKIQKTESKKYGPSVLHMPKQKKKHMVKVANEVIDKM